MAAASSPLVLIIYTGIIMANEWVLGWDTFFWMVKGSFALVPIFGFTSSFTILPQHKKWEGDRTDAYMDNEVYGQEVL